MLATCIPLPTVYSELRGSGEFEVMSRDMDEAEHSIEMHLPYVAKVMESRRGKFTVVPILVGSLKVKGEAEYGKLFSKYLLDPENLFIVSSDFCHWGKLNQPIRWLVIYCAISFIRQEVQLHSLQQS